MTMTINKDVKIIAFKPVYLYVLSEKMSIPIHLHTSTSSYLYVM